MLKMSLLFLIALTVSAEPLYREELKTLESDEKIAQIFCSEQATFAERQGASEDETFIAQPTQSEPNVSIANSISFTETLHPSWAQTFVVDQEILHEKTEHQNLIIFENQMFGRVFALDGVVQFTEADEPIYQEMLAHVPLFAHDNPGSVLIIGGGDGAVLREVLKHSSVKQVVLVDIDASVIEMSKKYFPKLSNGAFDDPRVRVVIQDAAEYIKSAEETFDVILCDTTDPIGPGAVLFTTGFYGCCKEHLRKDGILVNQAGVPFLQKRELGAIIKNLSSHFKYVTPYVVPVPTYVGGFMTLGWASDKHYKVSKKILKERFKKIDGAALFYYTPAIHNAAFVLPNYILKRISEYTEKDWEVHQGKR